jgi:hypothetical protein
MAWAGILLRDTTTLTAYEEYARESAQEAYAHEDQANPPKRRPRTNTETCTTQQQSRGPRTHENEGRTTPSGSNPLDPIQEDFTH